LKSVQSRERVVVLQSSLRNNLTKRFAFNNIAPLTTKGL
jgi:hypothetical protein